MRTKKKQMNESTIKIKNGNENNKNKNVCSYKVKIIMCFVIFPFYSMFFFSLFFL